MRGAQERASNDAVDDAVFRGLESAALRRAVLGLELRFHHDLLAERAEVLRLSSPLAWAIEDSALRSIAAVLGAELAAERLASPDHMLEREHAQLANDALLEDLALLGPIGVLTRHVCRATCDAVDVARAEGTDDLASAYRCALESLSASVWPCASALDGRAWWTVRPELGRCRRMVVTQLRAGEPQRNAARLYRQVWAHGRL
jgi:hypothetical protein